MASEYLGAKLPFDIRSPDRRDEMGLVEVGADWTMRMLELLRGILVWALVLFSSLLGSMHTRK